MTLLYRPDIRHVCRHVLNHSVVIFSSEMMICMLCTCAQKVSLMHTGRQLLFLSHMLYFSWRFLFSQINRFTSQHSTLSDCLFHLQLCCASIWLKHILILRTQIFQSFHSNVFCSIYLMMFGCISSLNNLLLYLFIKVCWYCQLLSIIIQPRKGNTSLGVISAVHQLL